MRDKILVIRGGPSSEHDVSMKTGRSVINSLKQDHDVLDVVIDKKGIWVDQGIETTPEKATKKADLVFNALHGEYGEDGQIQKILEQIGIPFTGPKKMAAAMSMNKKLSKDIYKKEGIKTPYYKIIDRDEKSIDQHAIDIFRTFPIPVVIKPIGLGSSVGVTIAKDFESLFDSLASLFIRYDKLMIEEYIKGKEATVGVIQDFRDKKIYSLLPIEIKPKTESGIFDYEAKYNGKSEEISPGNFTNEEKQILQDLAELAHNALDLRHYSRSDFIVTPRRGIYILETNSLPGLTEESLLPKSLPPVGSNLEEFLNHIIQLALSKNK